METTGLRKKVIALVEKADKQSLDIVNAMLHNSRSNLDKTDFP